MYAGNYTDTMTKAMTAMKGGQPPQLDRCPAGVVRQRLLAQPVAGVHRDDGMRQSRAVQHKDAVEQRQGRLRAEASGGRERHPPARLVAPVPGRPPRSPRQGKALR